MPVKAVETVKNSKFADTASFRRALKKVVIRKESLIVLVILVAAVIVFATIGRIPNEAAQIELTSAQSASSLQQIFESPVNAPYNIATYLTTNISSSIIMLRVVSFSVYVLACVSLFYALQHWHTTRAAALATAAFATNSVVLATARLGTPLIAVFSWFIFTALLLWQLRAKSNKAVPLVMVIGIGILLYTPGALWFFLVMGSVYFNKIRVLFKDVKRNAVIIGAAVSFVVTVPLILGFVREPSSLREWLLLTDQVVWGDVPRSILRVPSAFIYRMPENALINVGRLPVFDLMSGMLFLIGLNAYRKKLSLDRTRLMIGSGLAAIAIGALDQTVTAVILLIPFVFSIIAAGIEFLLDEWNGVFPKNPYARGLGSLLMTIIVLFGAYYHLTRFLVVWPQTPETKSVYSNSRIIDSPQEELLTETN